MDRRRFLASAAALPFAANTSFLSADEVAAGAVPGDDSGNGAGSANVSKSESAVNPALARYRLTLNRVLSGDSPAYTREFLLKDLTGDPGRRFTNFSGDLSGRWIGALASCAAQFGENFPALAPFVHEALALQKPEGWFGKSFNRENPNDDDLALLWGNGRLLVGLMEYHHLQPDPAVLAAARRLGDFLLSIAPLYNSKQMADAFSAEHYASSYICWTQQTEGLALLFAATKDMRYRDLCAAISARAERRAGDHVHGYLCSLRGTLMLYDATGERSHLDRVIAAWDEIEKSGDVLITGGVPERWSPKKNRTEGCAECDWMRLSLGLYRATNEPKYLAAAEHVAFNEFAMNQAATGDFGHANLDAAGVPFIVPVRAWWCCTLHGLRAFADLHSRVFRADSSEIYFDLPIDGRFQSDGLELIASSELALNGTIRIDVHGAHADDSLTVRRPNWAKSVTIDRDGRAVAGLRIDSLRAGERITAHYAMGPRIESADHLQSLPNRFAFFRGPWLLGISAHQQPTYFNELEPENKLMANSLASMHGQLSGAFDVPAARSSCAFIPAEFPDQPGKVGLHAVAEQTGFDPARWITTFQLQKS
jgi:DUF1680 family protein